MMKLSTDGDLVVSIWGRQVYLQATENRHDERVQSRHGAARPKVAAHHTRLTASTWCAERKMGLTCIDVETGAFRADYPLEAGHGLVTAAAFSHNNRWLAIGDYIGNITVLEVITSTIDGSC